ncbi:MAG: pentapeptide repeat-containing protein, partial [Candidatus Poribacteria bacterium]|nr:pentapeptide repeat-containing protein [Candidatus Poribacteria bacterium]
MAEKAEAKIVANTNQFHIVNEMRQKCLSQKSVMNFFSKMKENPLLIFQVILIVLLILLAIVFVVVMCFENPKRIFNLLGVSEKDQPKYEVLKFLGIGMGGVLVALQALASHRRAKAMEDTAKTQVDAANAQANAAQAQARANEHTEQGLRQERLKNAIEHLGHDSDSVRMGGAYELFHLAEDNEDLRKTAFDILCAHIRQTTGEYEYQKMYGSKPSEEIQSLLALLFVQEHEVFKGLHINLRESYLNGANLREARLQRAVLTGAHLQGAYLMGAHLQEANLSKAHLRGTSLSGAKLQKAELSMAHLQGAYLMGTHL